MNNFKNTLLALFLLGIASCTHEQIELTTPSNSPSLTITTQSAESSPLATNTRAKEPGTVGERSYSSLHIYYYKNDTDEKPIAYQSVTDGGVYDKKVYVPSDIAFADMAVDVYVIASPMGITMPATPTRTELMELQTCGMASADGTLLTYTDGAGNCIPMSAYIVNHNFVNNPNLEVNLTRTVAKLRIRVLNCIGGENADPDEDLEANGYKLRVDKMTLSLKRLLKGGLLFKQEGENAVTPEAIVNAKFTSQLFDATLAADNVAAFVSQTMTDADGTIVSQWLHTAYLNEYLFDATKPVPADVAKLVFNLPYDYTHNGTTQSVTEAIYEFPLDFPLKRNTIYQLTIRVYGPGQAAATLTVQDYPWNLANGQETIVGGAIEMSNDKFIAYADGALNNVEVGTITSAYGADKGSITATTGITVSPTEFASYCKDLKITASLPAGVNSGTITVTQDGQSKTISVERKVAADAPVTLYSVPEVSQLPADVSYIKVVNGSDWLEATTVDNAPALRTTHFGPSGATRFAGVIIKRGSDVPTMHLLPQQGIVSDFGFKDCARNVSRESEQWKITLSGHVKQNTNVEARLIIDDATKESLTPTTGVNAHHAKITIASATQSGVGLYTKKRWDSEVNTAANNGTRPVRLQIRMVGSGDDEWIDMAETGTMDDRNQWEYNVVFARTVFDNYGDRTIQDAIFTPILNHWQCHQSHPFFGTGRWSCPADIMIPANNPAIYLLWSRTQNAPNANSTIYPGLNLFYWSFIVTNNTDGTGIICYRSPIAGGTVFTSNAWLWFSVSSTVLRATIPVKEGISRPTDDTPITQP